MFPMHRSTPLFLAPIALALAMADTHRELSAAELNLRGMRSYSQSLPQASGITQLSDVRPTA